MTDDTNHNEESPPIRDSGKEFAARRTIVKGMASAVPVIMTIGCGQAMAQASSNEQCFDPTANTDCLADGEHDKWLRSQCPIDTAPDLGPGASELKQTTYWRGNTAADPAPTTTLDTAERRQMRSEDWLSTSTAADPAAVENCLVYVDTDGNEYTCDDGPGMGTPVIASCYNSFLYPQ